jgi:nucleotide-binding universal stress UspA family protein
MSLLEQGPVLVALDGSELAERALPFAAKLAEKLGTHLVLVTIWEGNDSDLVATFPTMSVEIARAAEDHFQKYLTEASSRAGRPDTRVIVRPGNASEEIRAVAAETGARCIAIATHGRSGIGRWVYGSTASSLLRSSDMPVLTIGPKVLQQPAGEISFKRVMVPLDGSKTSEQVLPQAGRLAKKLGATAVLVRSIQWAAQAYPYTLPDTYVPQLDKELEEGAKEYLRGCKGSLGADAAVEAFVVRGPTADSLLDFAEQQHADLVVMATHARSGIARAALGSVADRMLQGPAPVLLMRTSEAST